MSFLKKRRDLKKCYQVLASCNNFGQLNTAINMIYNYGKMYRYPLDWMKLDRKAHSMWREFVDRVEYEERLRKVLDEQKASEHTEG